MASDTDILIAIKTTADTAGAKQTVEAIKEIEEEDMTLQQQRDARTKGARYAKSQYVDPDVEEAAARRVANAATMEATMAEAASVRAARASAEKAAAEQGAAIKIEAALAKETAAAEAQAVADEAIAQKKILNSSIRALTPRNRELSAAMSVVNSPQALVALANPYVLAAAAVVTLGVVADKTFAHISEDMHEATKAGSDFEDKNAEAAIAIEALGSEAGTTWSGIKYMWGGLVDWTKKGADAIISNLLEIDVASEASEGKRLVAITKRTAAEGDAMAKRNQIIFAANAQVLADELKLQASIDNLAKGRETRNGTGADQIAANEVARQIQKTTQEDAILIEKIRQAQVERDDQLRKLHGTGSAFRSEEDIKAIEEELKRDEENLKKFTHDLGEKQKNDAVNLTNTVEEKQQGIQDALETKLTDNAKDLQEILKGLVDSNGAKSSPLLVQNLAKIDALLADGTVAAGKAQELVKITETFKSLINTTTGAQIKDARDLLASENEAIANAKALDDQVTRSASNQEVVTVAVNATAEAQLAHHAATVESIATLAPTPADKQAVVTAVQDTGKAIADKDNAIIAALTAIQTAVAGVTSQIQNQQQQIDNLFSRIR